MTSSFVCCAVVAAAAGSGRVAELPRPLTPPDTAPPARAGVTPGPVRLPTAPPDDVNPDLIADRERQAHLDRLEAGFEPFDLTYLPRPVGEVPFLFAARPAALFAHPDLRPYAAMADYYLGRAAGALGAATPAGPGLANVEWLLVGGQPEVTVTDSNFQVGGKANWFVVRARGPHDWAAAARRWFPGARPVSYRGATYLTASAWPGGQLRAVVLVQIAARVGALAAARSPAAGGVLAGYFQPCPRRAVYVPDGRTVVVDSEDNVRGLIDRLRAGRSAGTPAGWAEVDRGLLAVSFDPRGEGIPRTVPFVALPSVTHAAVRLLNRADRLALGFGGGRPVWVRVAGAWSDVRSPAPAAVADLARLCRQHRVDDADGDDGPEAAVRRALVGGRLAVRRLGFVYTAELPGDPFHAAAVQREREARSIARWQRAPAATAAADKPYVKPGHEGLPEMPPAWRDFGRPPAVAAPAAPKPAAKPGHEGLPPIPAPPPKDDAGGEFWKRFPAPIPTGPKP